MAGHRQSKKRRYLTWAVAGAAVVAGASIAAQTSMAATAWPAQKTFTGRAFDTCTAPSLSAMKAWHTGFYGAAAVYVAAHPDATPAQVATALVNGATSGVVTSAGSGSPNKLLKLVP